MQKNQKYFIKKREGQALRTKTKEPVTVICPWCTRGKTKADRLAEVNVTCHCTVCGNFYRANLKTLRTVRVRAAPKDEVE